MELNVTGMPFSRLWRWLSSSPCSVMSVMIR
jgi:hypothetical protein